MKQHYNNGPEGMPRVERMSDSTLDWVINGVNTDGMLVAGERAHQQLHDVCHAVAEETLARISWPERAGLDLREQLEAFERAWPEIHKHGGANGWRGVAWAAWQAGATGIVPAPPPERIHLGAFTVVRDDSLPADVAELRDERGAVARFKVTAAVPTPRQAPYQDFAGSPIYEGDVIRHPHSGDRGRVVFDPHGETEADQWRVRYGIEDVLSRLVLQVGEKGQAVVDVEATKASRTWGDNYMLQARYPDGSWQPSGHLARPLQEAIDLAERMNAEGGVRYRVVPWDGK